MCQNPALTSVAIIAHFLEIHDLRAQSRFLTEAFAADGDLVLAPIHRDATCKGGKGSWFSRAEIPFRDPGKWNESTYRDRADDIRRLASAIGTDHRFRSRADLSPFAIAAGDFLRFLDWRRGAKLATR